MATFSGPMPTGVTVSDSGRIFVNFPRWGDPVQFSVAEVVNGNASAYPDAQWNTWPGPDPQRAFVSVQSVVVDPKDRLWVLDTGNVEMKGTIAGGAKLVGIDLKKNRVFKTIVFAPEVALPTSYLNDVRFDLRRGSAGFAFITDSSDHGPNGIVVVDLGSGKAWRKLQDHPSTKAEPGFVAIVEGRPLYAQDSGKPPQSLRVGSDGIAISADGERLFYSPLASRKLYSVAVEPLTRLDSSEAEVSASVRNLGDKGASDGLESDAEGRVYATNYEYNAIQRRNADGTLESITVSPELLWPDTLALRNGFLYVMANQLHRQAKFQNGKDGREKPYVLFRLPIDAHPVLLKK